MEIDFNTGPVGKPDPVQPAARQEVVKPAPKDPPPFENIDVLEKKLKDVPPIRLEKVQRAKGLIKDVKYPPDEMLVGIANLLAMHIK